MSEINASAVKKMKVTDLRSELTKRGLDTKGSKQVLVDRLLAALESGGLCRKETTSNMVDSTLDEEIHDSSASITNGDANDLNNIESSTSTNLIEDLARLVDVLPSSAYANGETVEKSTSVEISEIKLELAMLWATVNSLQDKHIRNHNNASAVQEQVVTTRSMGT